MALLTFFVGLFFGIIIISPVEWLVHKYLLHTPHHKRRWFNRASSFAHNDIHHAAFKGPAHYYRDIVNEHVIVHFHWKHVLLIFGIATVVGIALNRLFTALIQNNQIFTLADSMYVVGLLVATAIGYAGYEISHHYMHVIGERRLAINRIFGDYVQGGENNRDGKLRFPKPFLDACCNIIENTIDKNTKNRLPQFFSSIQRLEKQFSEYIDYNTRVVKAHVENTSFKTIFNKTTSQIMVWEKNTRDSFGVFRKCVYLISRHIQWIFRGSPRLIGKYFRHIDNNHFLHHHKNDVNLNVFLTWADIVFKTRRDSSVEALQNNKQFWLCPNSPDTKKFALQ